MDESDDWYRGLMFTYYGAGPSTPALVLWDEWQVDAQGDYVSDTHTKLALREFRYHPNPRGRFMVRDLNPNDPDRLWQPLGSEQTRANAGHSKRGT